jgi:STE24 endopeptidase
VISTYRRIPADPTDFFSEDEVKKAKDYQRPLNAARAISLVINVVFLALIIFTHSSPRLADAFSKTTWPLRLVAVVVAVTVVGELIDLPVSIWTTFSHEKKWGFSTQTPRGFVVDQLKGLIVACVIQIPLLLVLWWVIRSTDRWWLYGWAVFYAFSVLIGVLFPIVVAPLFNKFTALEDESLANRLRALANEQGMRIKNIKVMDASKRTRKDNAYFAGLGKTKQIVLFDNLLTQSPDVIASVVGHEIGHWKRRHIVRMILTAAVTSFAMFLVVRLVLTWQTALDWAGVGSVRDPAAIPLLIAVFGLMFPFTNVLSSFLSRAYERQADIFALDVTRDHDAFVETEHGLSTRNLIDLAPSWFRYIRLSHPPPAERLQLAKLWAQRAEQRT